MLLQAATDSRTGGRLEQAEERASRALSIAETAGDRGRTAAAINILGNVQVYEFKIVEGRAILERGLEEFADADEAVLAEIRLGIARCQFYDNDFRKSLQTLEGVLEVAERRQLIRILSTALIHRGNALWSLNRRREAFGVAGAARDLATEHGLNDVALRVMGNFANAQSETDCAAAMASWREAIDMARRLGLRASLVNGVANFGYTAFLAGEWDAGLAEMDPFLAENLADRDRLIMLNNASIIRVNQRRVDRSRTGRDESPWGRDERPLGAIYRGSRGQRCVGQGRLQRGAQRSSTRSWRTIRARSNTCIARQRQHSGMAIPTASRGWSTSSRRAARTVRWRRCGWQRCVPVLPRSRSDPRRRWRYIARRWLAGARRTRPGTRHSPASTWPCCLIPPNLRSPRRSNSTREILERLGAQPYLDRLDAATAASKAATPYRTPATTEVAVSD